MSKKILSLALFSAITGISDLHAATPHLDAVESALRKVSPATEGYVWERTEGNQVAEQALAGDSWLLQTPNCWGDGNCQSGNGTAQLAERIYQDIANAQRWIDITTLATYPDGLFQKAIVDGIKVAVARNPDITIRVLGGTPPGMGNFKTIATESAHDYMSRLKTDLGSTANTARVIVSGVETSWLYSWNHAKIIAVDGKTAIVGGHNLWEGAYAPGPNPVADVSMRLSGPAAVSAHRFADQMWDFACTWSNNWWNTLLYVDVARTARMGSSCPRQHSAEITPAVGNADVLALGGLGFGMTVPGGTQGGGLAPAQDSSAACSRAFKDYFNNDRAYSVANPEEAGLRALVESARENVFLSQQDLIAPCVAPVSNAYYDARLFDILADKLLAGVKVRIVVSSPGAKQSLIAPYSNMKKMSDLTGILVRKVSQRGKLDTAQANNVICRSLQLAPVRHAAGVNTWANGNGIANHAKVVAVDDAAFYVGSKNLYPTTLQDFGFIVEDDAAARTFVEEYQEKLWENARSAATVDFETGACQL